LALEQLIKRSTDGFACPPACRTISRNVIEGKELRLREATTSTRMAVGNQNVLAQAAVVPIVNGPRPIRIGAQPAGYPRVGQRAIGRAVAPHVGRVTRSAIPIDTKSVARAGRELGQRQLLLTRGQRFVASARGGSSFDSERMFYCMCCALAVADLVQRPRSGGQAQTLAGDPHRQCDRAHGTSLRIRRSRRTAARRRRSAPAPRGGPYAGAPVTRRGYTSDSATGGRCASLCLRRTRCRADRSYSACSASVDRSHRQLAQPCAA